MSAKKKNGIYSVKIEKQTCYRPVLHRKGKSPIPIAAWNESKGETDAYLVRAQERYGGIDGIGLVFDPEHLTKTPKRKGWVVVTPKGKRYEYENMGKKEAKGQFLYKIKKTRMPRGCTWEKLV